ncbi:Trypsin- protease [Metarhizium rileyi]|uniref:Trypsin-protease n=1 Tax=Metarhizium rileyi (strain RCEF 4871) TaxID=1649241 RepID=A0A166ZGQ8_METRR|nr:Trypsin- protease [Metarhizium rileyi RCEF 4871]
MVRTNALTLTAALLAFSATAATIDKRIVGGEDAKDGEFPFVVSIDGTNGICGGTLLDSTTVLTAGHCVKESVTVRAGSLRHDGGGVEARVASRTAHPEYRLNKWEPTLPYANNDIAIIKLETPIEKSDKIGYATLAANGSDPVVDSMAIIAGWGKQKPDVQPRGDAAELLAKVTIPIHARELCTKLDKDVGNRETLVCAGGNGKNACRYDSGGPLIDERENETSHRRRVICHTG